MRQILSALRRGLWAFVWALLCSALYGIFHGRCARCGGAKVDRFRHPHRFCDRCKFNNLVAALRCEDCLCHPFKDHGSCKCECHWPAEMGVEA